MKKLSVLLFSVLLLACDKKSDPVTGPTTDTNDVVYANDDTTHNSHFVTAQNDVVTLASFYANWFREPIEMEKFEGAGVTGNVVVQGIKYGRFIGGINTIVYDYLMTGEGGLIRCATSQIDFDPDEGVESPFEVLSGIPVFVTVANDSLPFGRVNVKFIEWARTHLIPMPTEKMFGVSYATLYNQVFARFFRVMATTHMILAKDYNLETEAADYRDQVFGDDTFQAGSNYLETTYGSIDNNFHETLDYSEYCVFAPNRAMGFWLRRHFDGSDVEIWKSLELLMGRYDSAWFEQEKLKSTFK